MLAFNRGVSEQEPLNDNHLVRGELGHPALFAAHRSPLCRFVSHVVGWRAEKKMFWVDAPRVIAAVAHKHSVGNWANKLRVGRAVRVPRFSMRTNCTVPIRESRASPLPAPALGKEYPACDSLSQRFPHSSPFIASLIRLRGEAPQRFRRSEMAP